MDTALKTLHDQLLEIKPENASHDEVSCPICLLDQETASAITDTTTGGIVSEDKTYTEGEYNALVAQVEELRGKVAELTAATEASEVDALSAAKADLEAQVTDLQSQLDAAVLESSTHKTQYDELVALLETTEAARLEAEAASERAEARIAQVKEVASFPEAYLEANTERFAAMSDEVFELTLEGFKAQKEALVAAAGGTSSDDSQIPDVTALTAGRSNSSDVSNPLAEVMNLRFQGIDARTV